MAHDHTHGHSHAVSTFGRAFAAGAALNLAFVVTEFAYGIKAGSLSLVADAGHNLGDVLGLLLAWTASVLARRLPTKRRTYGMRRSSILAALANVIVLLITVGGIAVEAVTRLIHPAPVSGVTVMWVAGAGIVVNGATALLFLSGRKGDLNIRGAFVHMAADAVVSAGVVVTGLVILFTGWQWTDPVVSLAIALLLTVSTWDLLTESVNLAMDAVPEGVDAPAVEDFLLGLPGVTEVHDLHIWGMSTTDTALTVHIVAPALGNYDTMLLSTCKVLHDRFGIEHATVQIEHEHAATECKLAASHVV